MLLSFRSSLEINSPLEQVPCLYRIAGNFQEICIEFRGPDQICEIENLKYIGSITQNTVHSKNS